MRTELTLATSGPAGAIAQQRLDLVAQSLADLENRRTVEFFKKFPTLLKQCAERHYPLAPDLLSQPGVQWDWRTLSRSKALAWSSDLIAQHENDVDWGALSKNPALPWSA